MQAYTCGFMFDRAGDVVLILKNKPDWQRGRLNGIGGKLEPGETPAACMAREWSEETGDHKPRDWSHFVSIGGQNSVVHFYKTAVDELPTLPAMTDVGESILIFPVATVLKPDSPLKCVPNLYWLLRLALETDFRVISPLAAQFTADSVEQERLAIEISAKICNGARPDPVQVLEWADALYRAEVGGGA